MLMMVMVIVIVLVRYHQVVIVQAGSGAGSCAVIRLVRDLAVDGVDGTADAGVVDGER